MDAFYGWIRNIIGYLIFISVIENLLPAKKYKKYLKLFSGMVLILLVMQPLTNGLRIENKIAHYYESFVFRYESEDLKKELLGMEDKRLEQMIQQYEEAVAQDLNQLVREEGFQVKEAQVRIHSDRDSQHFGTVASIQLQICEEVSETIPVVDRIVPVEPVIIAVDETTSETGADNWEENRRQKEQERAGIEKLQRKIVSYYNLEDKYVEIQFVEG